MTIRILVLVLFLVIATSVSALDSYAPISIVPHSGAEGGDALVIPNGDIINVRNIQGGVITDPNLDIGAGSAAHRGVLSLNYDVGGRVIIYDGRKHPLAKFDSRGIYFYRKVRVHASK